jgi:ribosomal-protein-alanine N-acetyltransferase
MIFAQMKDIHVAQVAELEKICFGSEAWSEKSVTSELENKLALWLVADEGGKVLGYVGSQTVLDETDMMNVAVHPDYRNQGIATGLIVGLIGALKQRGSRCLTLEVRASNEPAKKLYEGLGFSQIGLRKNYYRNPKEDALILRKEWEV